MGWTSINPSYFDVNYRGTIGFDTHPYAVFGWKTQGDESRGTAFCFVEKNIPWFETRNGITLNPVSLSKVIMKKLIYNPIGSMYAIYANIM